MIFEKYFKTIGMLLTGDIKLCRICQKQINLATYIVLTSSYMIQIYIIYSSLLVFNCLINGRNGTCYIICYDMNSGYIIVYLYRLQQCTPIGLNHISFTGYFHLVFCDTFMLLNGDVQICNWPFLSSIN